MSKPIKISKFKKNVSDSHFIHFFTVFSGIFLVMTVIILQVMRYGVYSSVDSSLKYISTHPKNYINMVMSRTAAYLDNSNIASVKLKPGGQTVANTDIILFTSEEEVINYFDAFSNYQFLKPNKKNLGGISELTLTNIFGQDETYHAVTVKVNNPAHPNVTYMTAIVNIDQLVNAKERYEKIIIFVMTTFWIISIGASIYLAKWAQKPIIENYERQKAFVENASHELRTPLAVLQNRLETLFRKPNATILENSENIASSLDEVRNMRILTTNLLNLARRDDGIKPELAVIKPTLFDSIFENYDLIAQENGKNFTGHNMIQDSFKTDKTLLKQLMTILFDNAIKYTDNDGSIDFTISETDKYLFLEIADNGPGISEEDKVRIFDRFYRVDKARTRQQGGFGLGLSLAQQIVNSLRGNITVIDNKPRGSIFKIKLPKVKG